MIPKNPTKKLWRLPPMHSSFPIVQGLFGNLQTIGYLSDRGNSANTLIQCRLLKFPHVLLIWIHLPRGSPSCLIPNQASYLFWPAKEGPRHLFLLNQHDTLGYHPCTTALSAGGITLVRTPLLNTRLNEIVMIAEGIIMMFNLFRTLH